MALLEDKNKKVKELVKKILNKGIKSDFFKDHILKEKNEDVKSCYIKLLIFTALNDGAVSEERGYMLKSFVKSLDFQNSFEDYLKAALKIDEKEFEEIIKTLKENDLEENIIVDLIIMVEVNEATENELNLLADIIEVFELESEKVRRLIGLAKAIVDIDIDEYRNVERKGELFKKNKGYLKSLFDGKIVSEIDYELWIGNISFTENIDFDRRKIEFIDANISFKDNLALLNAKQLYMADCTIQGGETLIFNELEKLELQGVIFNNILSKYENCNDVEINKCTFKNIKREENCVFLSFSKVNNASIKESIFRDIISDSGTVQYLLGSDCFNMSNNIAFLDNKMINTRHRALKLANDQIVYADSIEINGKIKREVKYNAYLSN